MRRLGLCVLATGIHLIATPSTALSAPHRPRSSRNPFQPPVRTTPPPPSSDSRNILDYPLEELKHTAIITTDRLSRLAILENSVGIGFTIRPGTEIGPSRARVVDIEAGKVLVEEKTLNEEGAEVSSSRELRLHSN
jgi:Tfp pilus assembly protein PilP